MNFGLRNSVTGQLNLNARFKVFVKLGNSATAVQVTVWTKMRSEIARKVSVIDLLLLVHGLH